MIELEALRDHARQMAGEQHRPSCDRAKGVTVLNCGNADEHAPHMWQRPISNGRETIPGRAVHCFGLCFGCMTDDEREGWKRQADELDAYLDGPITEQETLI